MTRSINTYIPSRRPARGGGAWAQAGQVRHLLFYCHEFCCNACVRELLVPSVVVAETVCRACGREPAPARVAVGGGRRGAGDGQRRAAPPPPHGLPAHRRPQPASPRPQVLPAALHTDWARKAAESERPVSYEGEREKVRQQTGLAAAGRATYPYMRSLSRLCTSGTEPIT